MVPTWTTFSVSVGVIGITQISKKKLVFTDLEATKEIAELLNILKLLLSKYEL